MTSEDERSESSEKSSGEREGEQSEPSERRAGEARERSDDPRDSEDERSEPSERRAGEARERSDDPRDSEDERSEPSEESTDDPFDFVPESNGSPESNGDDARVDDIPLNIAGHEEEKKRREQENGEVDDDSILAGLDVSAPDDDDDGEEVEPVELLVQLAKDGEIEPWDIDIVTVTDKFLDRLDDADLRAGGRALFYASVLLRMKSDVMLEDDEPDHEEEAWDAPMGDPTAEGPAVDPFDQLEREIDRRLDRKHARGTPQTLDELVRDLRDAERDTLWKESRTYDTSGSPHGYARGTQTLDYHAGDDLRMDDEPTEAEALGVTHDEHMEDIINDVYVALQGHYDQGRDEVLYEEIEGAGGSRVDTFLGLLFLAHRGQVRLQQDELFGDLWVQDPAAVAETEEVLAD